MIFPNLDLYVSISREHYYLHASAWHCFIEKVWQSGKNMDFGTKQAWVLILILGPKVQFSHWKLEKNLYLFWHSSHQEILNEYLLCVRYWTEWLGWKMRNVWLLLSRHQLVVQTEWQMCTQTTVVQCEHVPVFKPSVDEHPKGNAVSITCQRDPERTLQRGAGSWKTSSSLNLLRWGEKARSKGTEA